MLIIKYSKTGRARYIPHLDTLRHIQRILRRADIETEYSAGYNPHMLVFMSNPLPLGFESECEYFVMNTPCEKDTVINRFNENSIEGLSITGAACAVKDPKVQAMVKAADYEVRSPGIERFAGQMESLLNGNYVMSYESRNTGRPEIMRKETGGMVLAFAAELDVLKLKLCAGQDNLRPDRLVNSLLQSLGISAEIDIIKKKVYTLYNNSLTPLDLVLGIDNI